MGCRIKYNGTIINPKNDITPIYNDSNNIIVEKRYHCSTNQIGLTGKEQYLFEKKCLTILKQNFIDYFNVNFYPFPVILKDDPSNCVLTLSFCGNTIKNIFHNSILQQKLVEYNFVQKNIQNQINNILFNLKKNNIYHLDVKQSNVCVNKDGFISLIDFGIGFINSNDVAEYIYRGEVRKRDRKEWFNIKLVKDFNIIVSHLNQPKITAVLPCYNRPIGAKRQILNICKQDINGWDAFIIGDNCPSFDTMILNDEEINKNLNRARRRGNVIHSSKDYGEGVLPIPHFFNRSANHHNFPILGKCGKWGTGIINYARKYAIGEYFIWINDDDIITKDHFSNYLQHIDNTKYDMVILRTENGENKRIVSAKFNNSNKYNKDGLRRGTAGHSNVIIRTDCLKQVPDTMRGTRKHDFLMISDIINAGFSYKVINDNKCTYWNKYDGRTDDWDGNREGVYLGANQKRRDR